METLDATETELRDAYRFPGWTPQRRVRPVAGDPEARVVVLTRREKKRHVGRAARGIARGTITAAAGFGTSRAARSTSISMWWSGAWTVRRVAA